MKRLLTLSIILGFIFPGVYSEETGWNYKQTTLQSFYMFDVNTDLRIDGEPVEESDVIGAFTADGVCVGWTQAVANNGYVTVPTVGDDGSDYSGNYLQSGDVPTFRIFDASSGDETTPTTQSGVMALDLSAAVFDGGASDGGFSNNAIYISSGPATGTNVLGCSDTTSCTFAGDHWLVVTEFNGDTAYQTTGGTITTNDSCLFADCAGECGGSAVIDDCGVCGGGNADDLGCGCFEPGPSGCDETCGSTLEFDCAGVCGGPGEVDACGDCDVNGDDGDNSACTGCTDDDADNYDAGNLIDDGSCEFTVDAPANVTAESGPARVILSWDAVDADSYDVFLDGVMVASTGSSSTQVLGLSPGVEYCFTVIANKYIDYLDETISSDPSNIACATPTESVGITWGWQMTGNIDGWGFFEAESEHNYLGFSATASNGFNPSLDIPQPPLGASQNYIEVYFSHPEWSNVYGDLFTQDVRSESPEDLPSCDGQDVTNLECNLAEFEVLVVSDMAGESSLTFEEFSTQHALNGADVPIPANVHTYAEVDGVHYLIEEGTKIDFWLSENEEKMIKITIGNIVPQAPSNLTSDGGHLQIDLDWDSDTDDIQNIAGRYPATSFNVYRDGGPLNPTDLSALISIAQENTDYNDQEDMEGNVGYGLLWESTYGYTVTGNNEAGESTDGHRVSHHDGTHTDVAGRQSDTSATTDDNMDPVSVTEHVETLNGTNIGPGHYEITHNGSPDANTVNIHADGSGSNDGDVNLAGDVETDQFGTPTGRYLWSQVAGEIVELFGATTSDVSFDIANIHDGDTKSITLNLHVETDYPTKLNGPSDLANGAADGIGTHMHDQEITVHIDDEPNHDPVAPAALDLRLGGNDLSILTFDDFLSEDTNDTNDYDGEDQIWYVPHDADPDTDLADLHFDGTSTDADAGDLPETAGEEIADDIFYQWSLITGAAAGFTYVDLNDNGLYDFGEPIFNGGGEEIYYETNYGDAIADGPAPEDLGTDALQSLQLPADVYILNLHIEDNYGDSDFVSYVIGVSAERNATPTSDAGIDQEWYMNYEEDYKDIEMSDHEVGDTDHDPLLYSWSYSYDGDVVDIPSTTVDSQASNTGDYFDDGTNFHWNEINVYDFLSNIQGLVEGEHTFTLTATDPYGASESSSMVISVYLEPAAFPAQNVRVTNVPQAFKHIEIAWEEGEWNSDDFVNEDGVLIWDPASSEVPELFPYANTETFEVYMSIDGGEPQLRGTYDNPNDVLGETFTHLEPQLSAETDYEFIVKAYNSDDRLGDLSDVSQRTHDRPTITVLNPNGAEIASVGDLYNVDMLTTNNQFISNIDVFFLDEESGEYVEELQEPDLLTVNEPDADGVSASWANSTQIRSEGVERYYGAKVMIEVTDIGNYNDVVVDDMHSTGVLDEQNINVPDSATSEGNKQSKLDESDDSFTLAAHTQTKGYLNGGWHMFGSPLVPYESAMEVNLSECFGNFGANWIAYDQAGNYDISTLQLNLGQGYYLALSGPNDMFIHGDPVTGDPDNGHLASLDLSYGWTLTSNPLITTVDKDLLTVEFEGEVLSWEMANDAGWVQDEIKSWIIDSHQNVPNLNPFGGYWIHTTRDLQVHFTPHLNNYSSREVVNNNDWTLNLHASDALGDAGGDFVTITLKEDANNNFVYGEDEIDHPNPMRPDYIDMHIDRFDWIGVSDSRGITVESPYFSSDVRPINDSDDFQAWNISADAYNVPGDVTLSWDMTNEIESDLHLVVKGEAFNLKELSSIDVPTTSLDDMVVVVGDISSFMAPEEFALSAAYPNPFNPTTSLDLSLDSSGSVSVKIYNVVGQVVATLASGHMNAGYHTLTWDASNMASGMYFVKVEAGSNVAVQKMMLMK